LSLALSACATPARRSPGPALGTRIVENATAMVGQPYRYGGAAPGGFDCSGLVVYAASGVGLHLPRTAREQISAGVPVAKRNVRAGDLVFLHLTRKELHVGIALDAQRFVHAPSHGGTVRIDSLAAPPYAGGFIEARRVVGEATTAGVR
jgi:cell wall-associated NlpC family hydrolase